MITYEQSQVNEVQAADLLRVVGMNRPVDNLDRIRRMMAGANLIRTAWDGELLVGLVRALSDFSWTAYISEVAVRPEYQGRGIGRELIERTVKSSRETRYVLRSVEGVEEFYERLGFVPLANGYVKPRLR